jgi:tetratricopeptide (TPR) repeat protein
MPIRDNGSKASELTKQGRPLYLTYRQSENKQAQQKFIEALRFDCTYPDAYSWLSYALLWEAREGWNLDLRPDAELIVELARKGVELDSSNSYTRWTLGEVFSGSGRLEEALREYENAMHLSPPEDERWNIQVEIADVHSTRGDAKEALRLIKEAKAKRGEFPSWYLWCEGFAHFVNEDYENAITAIDDLQKLMGQRKENLPNAALYTRIAAQELRGGRADDDVKRDIDAIRSNSPNWNPEHIVLMEPFERRADRERWLRSFRQLTDVALRYPKP